MANTSTSRKRKADAVDGANKRPRLTFGDFGDSITLRPRCWEGEERLVVHKNVIAQRSRQFDNTVPGTQIHFAAKRPPLEAYLKWLYDGSVEILEVADTIREHYTDAVDDFKGKDSERDIVIRIFAFFNLWYTGHEVGDTDFCDMVMDAICRQTLEHQMLIFIFDKSFRYVIPVTFRTERCYSSFQGPAKWLIDRLIKLGDALKLQRVMRDYPTTLWGAIVEGMVQAQKSAITSHPSLGKIDPGRYHLNQ